MVPDCWPDTGRGVRGTSIATPGGALIPLPRQRQKGLVGAAGALMGPTQSGGGCPWLSAALVRRNGPPPPPEHCTALAEDWGAHGVCWQSFVSQPPTVTIADGARNKTGFNKTARGNFAKSCSVAGGLGVSRKKKDLGTSERTKDTHTDTRTEKLDDPEQFLASDFLQPF